MTQRQPHHKGRWRPEAWEDDLSRFALDESPFSNAPAIGELNRSEIEQTYQQVIDETRRHGAALDALIAADPFPLPNADDREGYVPESDIGFWVSGLHDFLRVRYTLGQMSFTPKSAFELGCASGRVLRHLAAHWPQVELWACDINYRHVRWVAEYLRRDIRCFHMPVLPHLPIGDEQLDLTCAFSVFTHLDVFETAWIAELYRVTRTGGIVYATFQTETTWENIRTAPSSDRRRALIERQSPETAELLGNELPTGRTVIRRTSQGPYRGLVFHHTEYLRDRWERYFTVLHVLPYYHGLDQTVLVLQK